MKGVTTFPPPPHHRPEGSPAKRLSAYAFLDNSRWFCKNASGSVSNDVALKIRTLPGQHRPARS